MTKVAKMDAVFYEETPDRVFLGRKYSVHNYSIVFAWLAVNEISVMKINDFHHA